MQIDKQTVPTGIILMIDHVQNLHLDHAKDTKVYVQLIAKTTSNKTQQVSVRGNKAKWDKAFFYNQQDFIDDDIKIQIWADDQMLGQSTKTFSRQYISKKNDVDTKIQIYKNGKFKCTLHIHINFRQMEHIVGGIKMPNLSLKPDDYIEDNIIASGGSESEETGLENGATSTKNCFSVLDNINTGFDVFPKKFKPYQNST